MSFTVSGIRFGQTSQSQPSLKDRLLNVAAKVGDALDNTSVDQVVISKTTPVKSGRPPETQNHKDKVSRYGR